MLVVEAPPFIENNPDVMVEEALERKPFVNVARPVCVSVPVCVVLPETVSEPSVASCEKRFVDDAVVENRDVEVAPPCPIENTVVLAFVTASNKLSVPHVASLLYGEVVPMPTLPVLRWKTIMFAHEPPNCLS